MTLHQDIIANIESAPDGPQIGAFFDFDGTLIAGFSATVFLKEQVRRGDLSPYEFLELVSALAQFSLGGMGFSGLMLTAARFMRGIREDDYIAFGQELYEQQIARKVYPESRALVQAHQRKGHTVAVISSATPYQVEPVARELGIEHVVCSRYTVIDGVFTGGIERPLCFGEGKVQAAEHLAAEHAIDLEQSFFYSDSDDDIQLLERVGHPQPLNPNTRLTEISERQGWPVRRFRSRGQPGLVDYLRSAAATLSLVPSALASVPIWALTGSQREARNFATSLFADVGSALIGLNLVVRGEENLWSNRPAVFVFNHQSKADVVIIARLLRRDIAGVGKREIRDTPIIGKTLELAGTVFIDRANAASAIEAMQPLVDKMRNGGVSVVIAPEGTRSISPKLGPFKKGAFHLAMQAGVPIVPIVIHNAGDVAPKGDFVFRPATVEVDVLPPVETSGWRSETIAEHVDEVRRMFSVVLGQERARAALPASAAEQPDTAPAAPKAARPKRRKKATGKQPRRQPAKEKLTGDAGAAPAASPREAAPAPGTAAGRKSARPVLKKTVRKKKSLKKAKPARSAGRASKPGRKPPQRRFVGKKVLPARRDDSGG